MNRFNSSIKQKTCKNPFCGKYPKMGYQGYCGVKCMPEELQKQEMFKRSKVMERNKQYKANLSRKLHLAANDKGNEIKGNLEAVMSSQKQLSVWFADRRKEMTGKCVCGCGQDSSRNNEKFWKFSIAHVLMKARFKSIATHPENWLELAFFGKSCHTVFDNMGYKHCKETKPILWEQVVAKFKILYPFISESEYKFIPDVLLQEINQI